MTQIAEIIADLKAASLSVGGTINAAQQIDEVVFDSRKARQGALFVAQKGEKVDGHKYIAQAIEQGCCAVLCEEIPADVAMPDGGSIIIVDSTHKALGWQLQLYMVTHRSNSNLLASLAPMERPLPQHSFII